MPHHNGGSKRSSSANANSGAPTPTTVQPPVTTKITAESLKLLDPTSQSTAADELSSMHNNAGSLKSAKSGTLTCYDASTMPQPIVHVPATAVKAALAKLVGAEGADKSSVAGSEWSVKADSGSEVEGGE